jgi:hypothetical protein
MKRLHPALTTLESPIQRGHGLGALTNPDVFSQQWEMITDKMVSPAPSGLPSPEVSQLRWVIGASPFTSAIGEETDWGVLQEDTTSPIWVSTRRTPPALLYQLEALFDAARVEVFEGGIESAFARSIGFLLSTNPDATLKAVRQIIFSRPVSTEAVSETLKYLSRSANKETHAARMSLLLDALQHSSPAVRDNVASALASLGDSLAVPALRKAESQESVAPVRKSMQEIIEWLGSEN